MNKVSNNCYEVSNLEDINYQLLFQNHGLEEDFIIDWADGTREEGRFTDSMSVRGLSHQGGCTLEFAVTLNEKQEPICFAS